MAVSEQEEFEFRRRAEAEATAHAKPSFLDNLTTDAADLYGGLAHAVTHPVQTVTGMAQGASDLGKGVIQQVRELSPPEFQGSAPPMNKAPAQAAEQAVYGNYGVDVTPRLTGTPGKPFAPQNLAHYAYTKPLHAALDASTLLAAPEAMGIKGAEGLSAASRVINPITAPVALAAKVAKLSGPAVAALLGKTTLTGPDALTEAAKAGYAGGAAGKAFRANISGSAPAGDVVNDASAKLSQGYADRNAAYQRDIAPISADTKALPFDDIHAALADTQGRWNYKGQVTDPAAQSVWKDIDGQVKAFETGGLNTPGDLDALKQSIGNLRSSLDPAKAPKAFNVADEMYNAVQDAIEKHSPDYAKVMADYSEASGQLSDIRKGLGLTQNNTTPAKLGKLLSAMKATTQPGAARSDLLAALSGPGDETLRPALAGQALRPITPGGLQGAALIGLGEGAAGLGALSGHPAALAAALSAAPFVSPRLMGEGAYWGGKATAATGKLAAKLKASGFDANKAALLAAQLSRLQPQDQPQ